MRCVFDTNVLVGGLLLPDSKPRQALDRAIREGRVLLSFAVLAELYEVLGRKKFRRYIDEEDVRNFLAALTREAQWVDVDVRLTACRDPKDDKFLELAVSGQATHIVTGDSDLLALDPCPGHADSSPSFVLGIVVSSGLPALTLSPVGAALRSGREMLPLPQRLSVGRPPGRARVECQTLIEETKSAWWA